MKVDFWFDPSCPYTWLTSRWLREAARVRPVEVRWRVMSLAVLNEGLEVNPEDPEGEYGEELEHYLWMPVRVCAAVRQRHGNEALGRFLTELGGVLHEEGRWDGLPDALARAGLPAGLAATAESTAYDAAVRASHAAAVGLVGPGVGTPVIAVPGGAFFGPVIDRVPRGEQAGRLWDGVLLLAATPGCRELRRGTRAATPGQADG